MLAEAAEQARRSTHPLHPYYSALAAKRGKNIATVAVMLDTVASGNPLPPGVEKGKWMMRASEQTVQMLSWWLGAGITRDPPRCGCGHPHFAGGRSPPPAPCSPLPR